MQIAMLIKRTTTSAHWRASCRRLALITLAALVCLGASALVEAGGKGNMDDIILYNGNIVMRGDKKGGSIVLASQHPHHEEVEYAPSFFYGHEHGHGQGGDLGGFRRRRR